MGTCTSATYILPVGYHIYSILYLTSIRRYVCVCAVCTMCVYVMLVRCVLCQCIASCRECSMATPLSSESPTPGGGGNQMSWQGERSKVVVLLCTTCSVLVGLLQWCWRLQCLSHSAHYVCLAFHSCVIACWCVWFLAVLSMWHFWEASWVAACILPSLQGATLMVSPSTRLGVWWIGLKRK